jgi:hypothetical protein
VPRNGKPQMTQEGIGPWTVETVLTHLTALIESNDRRYEQRFVAQALATDAALAAAERAVLKAEASAERRFEGVNEFRATLADQQRNLIPRAEVDVIVRGISEKMNALEKTMDGSIAERQAQVASLQKTMDAFLSERRGVTGGWGYAVGAVGLVLAILGFASRFWGP